MTVTMLLVRRQTLKKNEGIFRGQIFFEVGRSILNVSDSFWKQLYQGLCGQGALPLPCVFFAHQHVLLESSLTLSVLLARLH